MNTVEFNCTGRGQAPNWGNYDTVEVVPCVAVVLKDGQTTMEPWEGEGKPDCWTVYGRDPDPVGGARQKPLTIVIPMKLLSGVPGIVLR